MQLETQLADLQGQRNQLQQSELEKQGLQQQQQQLETQAGTLTASYQRLLALTAAVGEIEQLEERRDRIQQQLSRLEAARQFEAELRQLVTQGQTQHKHNTAQLQHLLAKVDQLATALAGQGGRCDRPNSDLSRNPR